MTQLNIQLLLTGDELMSGDIIDTNSPMIASQLKELGVEITRKVTVADNLTFLIDEIRHMSIQSDFLIINGGLGPTSDDLTAEALANVCELPLAEHPEAIEHLEHWCEKRKMELTQQNLKQALLPKDCNIIPNKIGSAVGFSIEVNDCIVMCTPGVPVELEVMMEHIRTIISAKLPDNIQTKTTRFQVFGIGESKIQKLVDESFPDWPQEVALGYRAASPTIEVKLTTRSADDEKLKQHWQNKLEDLLGHHIYHHIESKPVTVSEKLVQLLDAENLKLTLAESCTGGLIASNITSVSGASNIFEAGYVTYSNEIKIQTLGVSAETLESDGAVSRRCVIEMANGALNKAKADVVVAVSGIAGPNGGTPDKPVGTVWIAWGSMNNISSVCLAIPGGRKYFQHMVSTIGQDLLRRFIKKIDEIPLYIKEREVK